MDVWLVPSTCAGGSTLQVSFGMTFSSRFGYLQDMSFM